MKNHKGLDFITYLNPLSLGEGKGEVSKKTNKIKAFRNKIV